MLYQTFEIQRAIANQVSKLAGVGVTLLRGHDGPVARLARANCALLQRITRTYDKPVFGIATIEAHGREVTVVEETVSIRPFCRLVRFTRQSADATTAAALARDPRVLVCAPLSGHHPTLLRDTIAKLLHEHDVYITDWLDARDVPVAAGPFRLADYVTWIQEFIRELGAADLHVLAVCQPTVPVLAAVALLASAGEPTPRTLTLMGGPVDARITPTAVNRLATERPLSWFESHMIHRVPFNHAGRGRAVYPGFLQLTAFVSMNPTRHADAYRTYWFDHLRGADGEASTLVHERFYDEYNAVLDMDAAYYLDTVKTVFQEFSLARGTWTVDGTLVEPAAITQTAVFTIEGAQDDISGLGQTAAAHTLCTGIPEHRRRHFVAEGCGHYGLFSGHRWRDTIYPEVHAFIRTHAREV
ncbi:MAG: polyhydroxyalkanoate depolymerase [Deltaproteobacteria bacterium]|nr:polyhydroxyalkanoate depolymerase [Deltaproteobacteria bacterium]